MNLDALHRRVEREEASDPDRLFLVRNKENKKCEFSVNCGGFSISK
jgi:hypothetical protein